jgi:hypothetical protein
MESCPLPTHTTGKKQLESRLVLWLKLMGVGFFLPARSNCDHLQFPSESQAVQVLAMLGHQGFTFGILCFWQWCHRILISFFLEKKKKKADLMGLAEHPSLP